MKKIIGILILAASSWALSVSSSITTANVEQTLFLSDATYKMKSFVVTGTDAEAQIQILYNHKIFIVATVPAGRSVPFLGNDIAIDGTDTISIKSTVAGLIFKMFYDAYEAAAGGSVAWGDITGKPSTFAPTAASQGLKRDTSSHDTVGHGIKVNDDDPRLSDARTPITHYHGEGDITDLVTDLSNKCASNDSRLSDNRNAADVYSWAKQSTKPTYTYTEVGADASGASATVQSNLTTHSNLTTSAHGGVCASNDSRLSDARTPTAHNQDASTVNAGTLDGDRLPALSTTKKGGCPATGTPSGKYLKDDGTWATVSGGSTPTGTGWRHVTSGVEDGAASTPTAAQTGAEPALGNPASDGYVLSSTAAGARSWVAQGAGSGNGYCLNVQAASQSTTTDAQTMYWGGMVAVPSTTANRWRVYIPKSGTIKAAYIYSYAGTAGTNEAWVMNIRLNNTTDYQIASITVGAVDRVWSNVGLSISVVAGDYIEIKEVQPTWSTNPATVTRCGQIYIE